MNKISHSLWLICMLFQRTFQLNNKKIIMIWIKQKDKHFVTHSLYTSLCTEPASPGWDPPWDTYIGLIPFQRNRRVRYILSCSGFCRGSRTPYWGLEPSPSWMPASSRKGKSSGGEGPVGHWHRDGHRVRSANRTSRPQQKAAFVVAVLLIFFLSLSRICSWGIFLCLILLTVSPMLCFSHKLHRPIG